MLVPDLQQVGVRTQEWQDDDAIEATFLTNRFLKICGRSDLPVCSDKHGYRRSAFPSKMSALPPKADIQERGGNVRFGPIADIGLAGMVA